MSFIRPVASLAALCASLQTSSVARAQSVDRLAASQLDSVANLATINDSRGGSFRMSSDGAVQYVLNRRTGPSHVEMHCAWDDLLIVRSGSGTLQYSRKVKALRRYASWEWRGQSLVEATNVTLLPGDVVRIPAGEAHVITSLGDAPLVYLIVKNRALHATPCGSLPQRGQ